MTTLADRIIEARGTERDTELGGMIGRVATKIETAQRFCLNRDAALAALQLMRSRPSNLVRVMPVCRLPYDTMWMELDSGISENHRGPEAPVPWKQGTLIESIGDRHGTMTVAWAHGPNEKHPDGYAPNASPYSLYFDFREDGDANQLVSMYHASLLEGLREQQPALYPWIKLVIERMDKFNMPSSDDAVREFMLHRAWWSKWANDKREIEALHMHDRHMRVGLSPNGLGGVLAALGFAMMTNDTAMFAKFMHSWEQDVEGEGPLAQFFIAMLNSRNCVERDPVSMERLNKARAKRRDTRPPLVDYTTIKLVMSKARARAAQARGMSPEITHEQHVMGHFKTRRTGVFWWSPFDRYVDRGLLPSPKQRYEVEAR